MSRWEQGVVAPEKLAQRLARLIADEIVDKGLQPGDMLEPEAVMLSRYGVGRASLREGLRIVEEHGLLQLRQGKGGPVVAELGPQQFARMTSLFCQVAGTTYRQLGRALVVLEPMMAKEAAERVTPEAAARLASAVERERASTGDDIHSIATADEFHLLVAELADNPVLTMLITAARHLYYSHITSRVSRVHGHMYTSGQQDLLLKEHQELADAIIAGNGSLAESLMSDHLAWAVTDTNDRYPDLVDQVIVWE